MAFKYPPLKHVEDYQWVFEVECRKLENSAKLKQIWEDFDSNGVDVGPYSSSDEKEVQVTASEDSGQKKKRRRKRKGSFCSFCKNRNYPGYKSHKLQDCPHLKDFKCPNCSKTGHTTKHCSVFFSV